MISFCAFTSIILIYSGDTYVKGGGAKGKSSSPRPTRAQAEPRTNSMRIRSLINDCASIVEGLAAAIDMNDATILANTLKSIAKKAEESKELQSGLVKAGICPVICSAARAVRNDAQVAETCLIAISLLSRYGEDRSTQSMDNIIVFGESGVAEAIAGILRDFGENELIISLACEVICHLNVIEVNRTRFGEASVVELLLKALLHFAVTGDNASKTLCPSIVSSLSYATFKHAGNRARLAEAENRINTLIK